MKKLIITLLSITTVLTNCNVDDINNDSNLITINLIEASNPDLFKKTVILYEDDQYLISTYFEKYISSYPYDILYGYDDLKIKAIQDTLTQDTLLMQNYLRLNKDSTYILAHHLEQGSCLIYDKKLDVIIKTIKMEYYQIGGPMTLTSGRRFYIRQTLFLETVDQIS